MDTPILQHLLKLLISLLMALLPFYTVLGQKAEKKEEARTIKVKMFKSVDGKLVYAKDTVINAEDHEKQLKALKQLKFDTKTWKKLEPGKIMIDSLKEITLDGAPMAITIRAIQDTAVFRRLKDARVYRMEKTMSDTERAKLFERIKGATGDSFLVRTLKAERIMFLNGDSVKAVNFSKTGDVPDHVFRITHNGSDSSVVVVKSIVDSGVILHGGEGFHSGNFTTRYATSDKIKIETDESGKTTVYEVDEKGNKKEIDAYHFGRSGEKATVILLRNSKVEDITKEDKKALKEAGVKVEKSAKKELKVENLSYYPNPSNGRFNVSFTLPEEGEASLRILNAAGKQVIEERISNPTTLFEKQLDLTKYGSGIYYLQLEQGGKTLTKRLLVQ